MDIKNFKDLMIEIKKWPKFLGESEEEMTTNQFVDLEDYPNKTILIKDSFPLLNDAFPSTFNLSVSEYLWMKMCEKKNLKVKNFCDYTKIGEHSFWTITKNIRVQDLDLIIDESNNHLLLFHIAGIGGFSITPQNLKSREFFINNLLDFFDKYLDIKKMDITYFGGGMIEKHGIKKEFLVDINYDIYKKLEKERGFNLVEDYNESFLSLQVFGNPIHWGYRNEFLFKYKNNILDLGTIECLPYIPKYKIIDGRIKYEDVLESNNIFIGSGIGLERLLMVIENKENIWDISIFKQLLNILRVKSKKPIDKLLFISSEIIRVLQSILHETGGELSKGKLGGERRRRYISKFLNTIVACFIILELDIDIDTLNKFTKENKNIFKFDFDNLSYNNINIEKNIFDNIIFRMDRYKISENYKRQINVIIDRLRKN